MSHRALAARGWLPNRSPLFVVHHETLVRVKFLHSA